MSVDIMAFFACSFNIVGLLFLMGDTQKINEKYKELSIKRKIAYMAGLAAISALVIHFKIYLAFFLAIEYIIILLWFHRKKRPCLSVAIKGIIALLLLFVTEFAIAVSVYYGDVKTLTRAQCEVLDYVAMATVLFYMITIYQAHKMEKGSRKGLIIALGIRSVENMIWMEICIFGGLFEREYTGISVLFLAAIAICYIVFLVVSSKVVERSEIEKRADIHINTYEYYLHMEEEHLRIRKMYHDMKNQLMILENEKTHISEADSRRIQGFSEELDALKQFYHTGINSLDILLFDGKMKAEAKGIAFEAVILEGCLSFMKEEDVNVIFSNAIINAIEACEKITEGPKSIKIKAGKNLDDTMIYVKNTVNPKRTKGSLHTSKKNKELHGIGMTSIQECAEKYHGYVSIIEENNTFQLAILFGGGNTGCEDA